MAKVVAYVNKETGERETLESMIKRFKKQVIADDIMWDVKLHEEFRTRAQRRKLKAKKLPVKN